MKFLTLALSLALSLFTTSARAQQPSGNEMIPLLPSQSAYTIYHVLSQQEYEGLSNNIPCSVTVYMGGSRGRTAASYFVQITNGTSRSHKDESIDVAFYNSHSITLDRLEASQDTIASRDNPSAGLPKVLNITAYVSGAANKKLNLTVKGQTISIQKDEQPAVSCTVRKSL